MESDFFSLWGSFTALLSDYFLVLLIIGQIAYIAMESILIMANSKLELRLAGDAAAMTSGTTGIATAGGMLDFINIYAPAIGILISFVSVIIAAIFYILNYRINRKKIDADLRAEIRKELEQEKAG